MRLRRECLRPGETEEPVPSLRPAAHDLIWAVLATMLVTGAIAAAGIGLVLLGS